MKRITALAFASFLLVGSLAAQSEEPLSYRLGFAPEVAGGTVTTTIYGHTTNSMGMGSGGSPNWSTFYGTAGVMMIPGKNYTMTTQSWGNGSQPSYARIVFDPPPGFVVMVENMETLLFKFETSPGTYFAFPPMHPGATITKTIRLEPAPASRTSLPFGASTSIRSGKVIWEIGLGNLKNGKPAGAISLRSDVIAVNTYKPSGLVYATDSDEVEVISDGNGLRQVLAPNGLANIVFSPSLPREMEIRFYERSRVTTKVSGIWQVNDVNAWFTRYKIDTPDTSGFNKLRITKTVSVNGQKEWRTLLTAPPSGTTWDLDDWHRVGGTVLRREKRSKTSESGGTIIVERVEVGDHNGHAVATTELRYQTKPWGQELIERKDGLQPALFLPASPDLATNPYPHLTTNYYYHESSSAPGNYGKMRAIKRPDGSWERYEYHDDVARLGLVHKRYEPVLDLVDNPITGNTAMMRVTTYDYGLDYTNLRKSLPTSIETTEPDWLFNPSNTVTVKKREITYSSPNSPELRVGLGATQKIQVETIKDYPSASEFVTTVVKRFRADSDVSKRFTPDLIYSVKYPDNTQESHAYFRGTWYAPYWGFTFNASGTMVAQFIFRGVAGSDFTSITQSGQNFDIEDIKLIAGKSTVTMIVRDETGEVQFSDERVWTGSGYSLPASFSMLRGSRVSRNALGQVTTVFDVIPSTAPLYGVYYNATYSATVANGHVTSSTDSAGVVTDYEYDDRGRVKATIRKGAAAQTGVGNAQADMRSEFTYDGDDRLRRVDVGPSGGPYDQRQFKYDAAGRRRWSSVVGPDGNPLVSTISYSLDNRTITATQPGAAASVVKRHIDGRVQSSTDDSGLGIHWEYWSIGNGVYRVSRTTRPAPGSNNQANWEAWDLDWLGRRTLSLLPNVGYSGSSPTLDARSYSYNSSGQLVAVSRWNNTGAGSTAPTYRYVYDDMGTVLREGFDVNNNGALADPATDPTTTDVVTRHDWGYAYQTINNITAWWLRSASYRYPKDSTAVLNGRNWNQLTQLTLTTTERTVMESAAGIVGYSETLPDRYGKRITTRSYQTGVTNPHETILYNGRLSIEKSPAGDTAISTYDAYGRLTRVAGRDSIQVNYDYLGATGFLDKVRDSDSTHVTYGYDTHGRVKLETLASGGTRRYGYDTKGRLHRVWGTAVDPIQYAFDQFGRLTSYTTYRHDGAVTDGPDWPSLANGGATSFAYDDMTGLVRYKYYPGGEYEEYSYGAARNLYRIRRSGDSSADRIREWKFENWSNPMGTPVTDSAWRVSREVHGEAEYVHYTYRRDGSIETIKDASGDSPTDRHVFTYHGSTGAVPGGLAHVDLPGMFKVGINTTRVTRLTDNDGGVDIGETPGRYRGAKIGTTTSPDAHYYQERTYGGGHGLLGSVAFNKVNATAHKVEYFYRSNTSLVETSRLIHGESTERFRRTLVYEATRSRVQSIDNRLVGDSTPHGRYEYAFDSSDRVTSEQREGRVVSLFDGSTHGNREKYLYEDYKQITKASLFKLLDVHPYESEITGARRTFEFDTAGNRKSSTTGGGASVSYERNGRNQYTKVGTPNLSYRHGNLIDDGEYEYSYNARGELTEIAKKSPGVGAYKIENTYDYAGRRVRKIVRQYNNNAWSLIADRRLVYEGWQLIAELSGDILLRTYVWADAEANAIGASGGQGALIAIQEGEKTYAPVYDGRGNITGYVDASDNSLVAAYRYDVAGNVTNITGSKSLDLPFGYKSQYTDREVGLVYYSNRFYHPGLGRFIQRDPIGEAGGVNLYGFAGNDPVNGGDYLGMAQVSYTWTETVWHPIGFSGTSATSILFQGQWYGGFPEASFDDWEQSADRWLWVVGPGMDPSSYWQERMLYVPVTQVLTLTEPIHFAGTPDDGIGWVWGRPRPGEDILRMRNSESQTKVDPQAANNEVRDLSKDPEWARIKQLMKDDPEAAIDAAIIFFGIKLGNVKRKDIRVFRPQTDEAEEQWEDTFGSYNPETGIVLLGPELFESESPGALGATLAHEIEVHATQRKITKKERKDRAWFSQVYAMQEIQAYDYEIANRERFGLTDKQVANLRKVRQHFVNALTKANEERVNQGIYEPDPERRGLFNN